MQEGLAPMGPDDEPLNLHHMLQTPDEPIAEVTHSVRGMNPLEAAERLIELVRSNDDIANHADGCDAATLDAVENELGAVLPPSYRRLVAEFGTWDIAGQEFLGVYRTPAVGDALLGTATETLDARNRYGLPADLIVALLDGMGGLVVLDSSDPLPDGEYPVLAWKPGSTDRTKLERLSADFGTFALRLCESAVESWRGTAS